MSEPYKIRLSELVNEFHFEVLVRPEPFDEIQVVSNEVNRPGLALTGFYGCFEPERIQLIGNAENRYLASLDPEVRRVLLQNFVDKKPIAILYTTGIQPDELLLARAREKGIPVLGTAEKTSPIMAALISSLNMHLAPRITRHGTLVEVFGEGLLLLGDSGVGKSESAIELIKRGHRLIADDAVEIKRVSDKTLVGSSPEIIRHYIELRGIGIVDVQRLFGMGAVKNTERIDLVVQLETWVEGKMYDRLGLDDECINILGIDLPAITVPVRPGRDLAAILEIAAMNFRQKQMGYNTAEEFSKKLMQQMGAEE